MFKELLCGMVVFFAVGHAVVGGSQCQQSQLDVDESIDIVRCPTEQDNDTAMTFITNFTTNSLL
jgi:hypothetical protein